MQIELIAPLGRAWRRMVAALFRPFRAGVWFTVGFCAWLAGLAQGSNPGGSLGFVSGRGDGGRELHEVWPTIRDSLSFLEPLAVPLIVLGALLLLALVVVVLWLSSRGQFLFVDNVVRQRAAVVDPWREHARLGDSLFWWRVGFAVVGLVTLGLLMAPLIVGLVTTGGPPPLWAILVVIPLMTLVAILLGLIQFYLIGFVVPIMYRRRVKATQGWGIFLRLFSQRPGAFLLFALWILMLHLVVWIGIFVLGCLTCCVAWIVVALPYLGTVALLPLLYTYRGYSLEFLAQFGPEYDSFAPADQQ